MTKRTAPAKPGAGGGVPAARFNFAGLSFGRRAEGDPPKDDEAAEGAPPPEDDEAAEGAPPPEDDEAAEGEDDEQATRRQPGYAAGFAAATRRSAKILGHAAAVGREGMAVKMVADLGLATTLSADAAVALLEASPAASAGKSRLDRAMQGREGPALGGQSGGSGGSGAAGGGAGGGADKEAAAFIMASREKLKGKLPK